MDYRMARNRRNLRNDNMTDPTLFNKVISTDGIFQEFRVFLNEETENKPQFFKPKKPDMNNVMNTSRIFGEIKK
jgi:hypothetical protein